MKQIEKHIQEANILLVRSVKKHRALYDMSTQEYSLKQHTQKGWESVAKQTGLTAQESRVRWRNLRISYLRYLRQKGKRNIKPYYLLTEMSFMEPHVRHADKDEGAGAGATAGTSTRDRNKIEYEVESQEDNDSYVLTIKGNPDPLGEGLYTTELVDVQQQKKFVAVAGRSHNNQEAIGPCTSVEDVEDEPDLNIPQAQDQPGNSSIHTEQLLMELGHADLSFFRSILPDVETMTMAQKSKFKLAVLASLNEILYG